MIGTARIDALRADLEDLGHPTVESDPATDPLASLDEAIGAAYVLEGSRIGGKMLSRMIRAALPQAPLTFLDYPAEPGFWQKYTAQLAFIVDKTRWPGILSGANHAFGVFQSKAESALKGSKRT